MTQLELGSRQVDVEAMERDLALDILQRTRDGLVTRATGIAMDLWQKNGEVSSPEVWHAIEVQAQYEPALLAAIRGYDPRWMGAVFRRGWRRIRWEATGSHKRPVAVWTR